MIIRICQPGEEKEILAVINDGAEAYRGIIPSDCWKEPYMDARELTVEIASGVVFWCADEEGKVAGVMGLQHVEDVALIRHSYVRRSSQGRGIGTSLLEKLIGETESAVLAGTWESAKRAHGFYVRNGFTLLAQNEWSILLKRYWSISPRQMETSVVLGDGRWCTDRGSGRI